VIGLAVLLAIVALGVAQLWSIVAVANVIGVLWTAALIATCVVVGLWLVARQGASVLRRAQTDLAAGRSPSRVVADGVLVATAGACLLVPGFVTAAVGFLLLLPPVRSLARPALERWWSRRVQRGGGAFRSASFGTAGPGGAVFRTVIIGDVDPGRGTAEDEVLEAEVIDVRADSPRELPPGS
jgi:UPF0716 protein FxsA